MAIAVVPPGSAAHASDVNRAPSPDDHAQVLAAHDGAVRAAITTRAADEVAADEVAADEARRQRRERGIEAIEPDERISALLHPGECIVAIRRRVPFERRSGLRDLGDGLRGDLYVTTCRLVFLGPVPVEYPLADIREVVVAAGMVRLVVNRNRGVEIHVPDPRVLRVEIAAVRVASRVVTAPDAVDARADQGSLR